MSLGGAIATKALALEVDKYKKIKFINDRSFSSVEAVIIGYKIFSIFKSILVFLAKISNWNINVIDDWKKIKGPKIILYSDSDEVIPIKGSLSLAIIKTLGNKDKITCLKGYSHCEEIPKN